MSPDMPSRERKAPIRQSMYPAMTARDANPYFPRKTKPAATAAARNTDIMTM